MEHKLRGQKHRQNKKRFQDKSKVVPKVQEKSSSTSAPKFVQKLESNWNRYDESPEDNEHELQPRDSTNFSLLSQVPISQGGHFQFKSDKNLESEYDFDSLRNNKLFSLDLNLLVSSLNTIPFHERCGLDTTYLRDTQISSFNSKALQNKIQYESLLKIMDMTKGFDGKSSIKITKDDCIISEVSNHDENLQNVYNKTELSEEDNKASHNKKTDQEDLEEWLDDILDT